MFNPIQMTLPEKDMFKLDISPVKPFNESVDEYYTEAVFKSGKKKLEPLLKHIENIKSALMTEISDPKNFDPTAFWRHSMFKDFEDSLMDIFGFRDVQIHPYIEKYRKSSDDFQSREMNAMIYSMDRFPIDGILTDEGFYDKTHSAILEIHISLGMIKELEPEELLAVLLHEFGHSIDPALVDVRYTETNILTKYITDRKNKITRAEKKYIEKHKSGFGEIIICVALLGIPLIGTFIRWVYEKILGKEKVEQKKLDKIKKELEKEKDEFRRQEYSEAFADSLARMYGYGPQLLKGLKKVNHKSEKDLKSWFKKERDRQNFVVEYTKLLIKDVHKTDIHRIRALLKEYDNDINDPNTPKKVKEHLQQDKEELEKVLNGYLNDFDNFQNRVNKLINDELMKRDAQLALEARKKGIDINKEKYKDSDNKEEDKSSKPKEDKKPEPPKNDDDKKPDDKKEDNKETPKEDKKKVNKKHLTESANKREKWIDFSDWLETIETITPSDMDKIIEFVEVGDPDNLPHREDLYQIEVSEINHKTFNLEPFASKLVPILINAYSDDIIDIDMLKHIKTFLDNYKTILGDNEKIVNLINEKYNYNLNVNDNVWDHMDISYFDLNLYSNTIVLVCKNDWDKYHEIIIYIKNGEIDYID